MEDTIKNTAFLLVGSNQGDREAFLRAAKEAIALHCGAVIKESSIYETEAWGLEDQPSFYNQALCVETTLPAGPLLEDLLRIEERMGRRRLQRYGPRTIDIDILLYNSAVISLPGLVVPHPELANRRFALACLAEIAPDYLHPVLRCSIADLLSATTDPLSVNKIN